MADRNNARLNQPLVVHRARLNPKIVPILDNVCTTNFQNGIHFIGIVDWAGELLFKNSNGSIWKVSNREEALEYILSVTKRILTDYHHMIQQSSTRKLPDDIAALRKVHGLRLTLDNSHVFFTHIDRKAHHFIIAVSWNKEDFGPHTFVGPVDSALSCRDELVEYLINEHQEWFKPEDYEIGNNLA